MLAFWLDPAASLPVANRQGRVSVDEALARALQTTERRVVRPLQPATLILTQGGPRDWFAAKAYWGLVPTNTRRDKMREVGLRNLLTKVDEASSHPDVGPLWSQILMGQNTRRQCMVPVSGWIDREPKGFVAKKPENGWATLAAVYDEVNVDGRMVLTFTVLVNEWLTIRSDDPQSRPAIIGENRRLAWMHALNPSAASWCATESGGPVDRRRIYKRR